jgi:hypothetical protein
MRGEGTFSVVRRLMAAERESFRCTELFHHRGHGGTQRKNVIFPSGKTLDRGDHGGFAEGTEKYGSADSSH